MISCEKYHNHINIMKHNKFLWIHSTMLVFSPIFCRFKSWFGWFQHTEAHFCAASFCVSSLWIFFFLLQVIWILPDMQPRAWFTGKQQHWYHWAAFMSAPRWRHAGWGTMHEWIPAPAKGVDMQLAVLLRCQPAERRWGSASCSRPHRLAPQTSALRRHFCRSGWHPTWRNAQPLPQNV